jgi:hypothetical protein
MDEASPSAKVDGKAVREMKQPEGGNSVNFRRIKFDQSIRFDGGPPYIEFLLIREMF